MYKVPFFLALVFLFFTSCDEEESAVDCDTVLLTAELSEVSNATCLEGGTATFIISDGLEPYEYSINGTSFANSNTFDGLSEGAYILYVRDENQCTAQFDFDILEDPSISPVEVQILQSAQGCGGTSGSVLVSASSSNEGALQYNIDGGSYSIEGQFDNLSNGDHIVGILDAFGCEEEAVVYVPSDISYDASVKSIIELNCAISNCHVTGTSRVDFTIFENIKSEANNIRDRTASGNMPPSSSDRSLTEGEVDLIACWVNDGAINN